MRHLLITTGLLLCVSLAPSWARAADPTDEVAAFNKAFDAAVLSMDNARVLALWAADGVSLLPGEKPIRGHDAMAAFLAQVTAQTPGWKVIAQESTCHDIVVHGDWASEWCETHQVASRPDGQPNWEGWGKMALVLEKQRGRWVIRQEMWNQGVPATQSAPKAPDASELLGLWHGTSVCTDRQAAPACKDEEAVYEFTAGPRPGVVHWIADKVVDGKRQNMGESDLTYDTAERCWKVEMTSTPVKSVWRLSASGGHLTGTARLLPGGETVRQIDLRKQ